MKGPGLGGEDLAEAGPEVMAGGTGGPNWTRGRFNKRRRMGDKEKPERDHRDRRGPGGGEQRGGGGGGEE